MLTEDLLRKIAEYCATKYPNVQSVKATNISLDTTTLQIITTLILNDKIQYDYVGGNHPSDYDVYYKNV